MKKSITIMLLLCSMVFTVGAGVSAQDDVEPCSPADIASRIDAIYAEYSTPVGEAADSESALEGTTALVEALNDLVGECEDALEAARPPTPLDEMDPGRGSMSDPFVFSIAGDSGEGFSLQLTSYIRPADTIIRNKNMFNDRPDADEVYIIVGGTMSCYEATRGTCSITQFDFQMVGDMGIVYEVPAVVYYDDYTLSLEVLGGVDIEFDMPFLVKKDDTNLRLLYRENMFSSDAVVYSAEPSSAIGIEVVSSGNLNVRSGPGTNYGVVNSLAPNTPVVAFGRNADGTWVQTSSGWVFAELLTTDNDLMILPVLAQ